MTGPNSPPLEAVAARTALDGSTPTLAALLDAVRPGLTAPHGGGRQVVLLEVHEGWTHETHGQAIMIALVHLPSMERALDYPVRGEAATIRPPCAAAGDAVLMLDRHMGTDGHVAIVAPAGAVDHAAVAVCADALEQGDTLLAQLTATATGPYGRLVLILAETRDAERQRHQAVLDAPVASQPGLVLTMARRAS